MNTRRPLANQQSAVNSLQTTFMPLPGKTPSPAGHRFAMAALSLMLFAFFASAIFVATMAVFGSIAGVDFYDETTPLPAWLVGLALAAVLLATWPIQQWLRGWTAHLIAWQRDDPYTVIDRLYAHIDATQSPGSLMPALVTQLAAMLNAPYVALETEAEGLSAAYGTPAVEPTLTWPLHIGSRSVGQLHIASPPVDAGLRRYLTRQVSLTLYAAQLSADLQTSRRRIVTAREEGQRRLRRDLHDGMGAALATMTLQADTVRELIERDPQTATALQQALIAQIQETMGDLRRIIDDLRPPALDDVGLAGALRALVHSAAPSATRFNLQLPAELPLLPAASEVAIYRIAQEATTNIVRHAAADHATIDLRVHDDALQLTISDDGRGWPTDRRQGVGLQSMRERATELGGTVQLETSDLGGCLVVARLPLER
jgi:signal transduction histidine kinase